MRIAHIDTGRAWRGGQQQVLLLLQGLVQRGHDVALLAPEGALADAARAAGAVTHAFRTPGDLDLSSGLRAAHRLAAWRPDLLHAHTAHGTRSPCARRVGSALPVVVSRRVLARVGAARSAGRSTRAASRATCA
jgi:hypothetical protein